MNIMNSILKLATKISYRVKEYLGRRNYISAQPGKQSPRQQSPRLRVFIIVSESDLTSAW